MVRLGYGPCVHPAEEMLDLVRAADQLGSDFCHLADDSSALDREPWAAAAAHETSTIRLVLGRHATILPLRAARPLPRRRTPRYAAAVLARFRRAVCGRVAREPAVREPPANGS